MALGRVFDYLSLINHSAPHTTKLAMRSPTLDEIEKELNEVTDWHTIGQNLNIPEFELFNIKSDTTLNNMKALKRAMLKWWVDNDPDASWSKLAQSLEGIHGNLAATIRSKYFGRCNV